MNDEKQIDRLVAYFKSGSAARKLPVGMGLNTTSR